MPSVIYADCHVQVLYAKCRYAECHYAKSRGAFIISLSISTKTIIRWHEGDAEYIKAEEITKLFTAVIETVPQ
jgi:hypothetical protein